MTREWDHRLDVVLSYIASQLVPQLCVSSVPTACPNTWGLILMCGTRYSRSGSSFLPQHLAGVAPADPLVVLGHRA